MDIGIREFRRSVAATFAALGRTGPRRVVNAGKKGSPAEAVLVPPELWNQLATLPSVRRKIAEHAEHQGRLENDVAPAA